MKKLVTADMTSEQTNTPSQEQQATDNLLWLQSGLNIENRSFELTGTVDESMVCFVLRCLSKLTEISREPITIYLNSPGGSVTDGFAIYDLITSCPCHITIVGLGQVGSMAPIIMLAADVRHALPNTYFMLHSPSYTSAKNQTVDHHMDDAVDGVYWKKEMLKILAKRTKKPYSFWEEKLTKQDFNFNLKLAKAYGIINSGKVKPRKKTKRGKK